MMERAPIATIAAMITGIAVIVGVLGAALPPAHAAGATSAEIARGRAFAELGCSACHQVRADQPVPAPVFDADSKSMVEAPSFLRIARERGTDAAYLRSAITLPHYPMREQMIGDEDLDSLIAYIQSLRGTVPAKP
jgi:mono/diheme cytochrome c family protein